MVKTRLKYFEQQTHAQLEVWKSQKATMQTCKENLIQNVEMLKQRLSTAESQHNTYHVALGYIVIPL